MKKIWNLIRAYFMKLFLSKKIEIKIEPIVIPMTNFILKSDQFRELTEKGQIIVSRRKTKINNDLMDSFIDFNNVYLNVYHKSLKGEKVLVGVSKIEEGKNRGLLDFTLVVMK